MKQYESNAKETPIYKVIMNPEEQYSIWIDYKDLPQGWTYTGKRGPKEECLAYIKDVWTDMRPLSLRKQMDQAEGCRAPVGSPGVEPANLPKSLVDRLCEGDHPVRVNLGPETTPRKLKDAIERGYLCMEFTQTQGQTQINLPLDRTASSCDIEEGPNGTGVIRVEGNLFLDYVRVRCVANVSLPAMEGIGHLVRLDDGISTGHSA